MISPKQNILIHKSAARWGLSREDYVECLMESTGCASSKQFTNQGQFERAMAELEKRAEILGTWQPLLPGERPGYWQKRLAMKGGGRTIHGAPLASSAQLHEIERLKWMLSQVHPRLKGNPRAADNYVTSTLDGVTGGRCILVSALTSAEAQRLIAALRRSHDNWSRKAQATVSISAQDPF